ncbi:MULTISPECIES: ParA family protein [unclassified Dietzia]|uniref:ParA family protein n=1 Tax=unclassified Dietzia TaxID=2617939 RepID=UPI0015CADA8A|nr:MULTISPECIES: ParA family protein [unclassified Dietzia]MBB1040140.1 ParA family protein [Dietzia sp. Cai40]MBB1043683.1 ParA family protein [Dietzia sp. DQ11-44]
MSEDETPIFAAARQANEVLHGDAPALPRPPHPRIITIANQKGGVGKTTSTVNLAASLALGGLGVLVIDMDPQGNASTALGVDHREGTPSSYELLMWEHALEDLMQSSPHAERLFCIPATIDLAGSEIELVGLDHREHRLAEVLNSEDLVSLGIDYVLIDCPPSLGLLTVNAMVAASEVLIPIQCEYYALEGVGQLLRNVELIQQHLNRSLEISTIMLTMYDGRTKLAEQVAGEVRTHFGDTVLRTVIPRSVKVSEAPGYGMTILQYDAGSRGALAYLDAAKELNSRADRLHSHVEDDRVSTGTEESR